MIFAFFTALETSSARTVSSCSSENDLKNTPLKPLIHIASTMHQWLLSYSKGLAHLSPHGTVNSDDDEALDRVEDCEEHLEKRGAPVCDG